MLDALLMRQRERCPRILEELRTNGRKTSHWAWWVFPTEHPGFSEPPPQTAVSRATAPVLLRAAPAEWREILELIAQLIEGGEGVAAGARRAPSGGGLGRNANGHLVLPPIDHGRVKHFISFWRSVPESPDWLRAVVDVLARHYAPPPPARGAGARAGPAAVVGTARGRGAGTKDTPRGGAAAPGRGGHGSFGAGRGTLDGWLVAGGARGGGRGGRGGGDGGAAAGGGAPPRAPA